jgi:fumarylpyruvate hydrolase
VRRIYCIGRNYAAHVVEMGGDPDREAPFFFQKNPDAADPSGTFPWPEPSREVHHEIELAVALKSGGRDIAVEDAMGHVWGYGVALDMTLRDLQAEAKKAGRRGRWRRPPSARPRFRRWSRRRRSATPTAARSR